MRQLDQKAKCKLYHILKVVFYMLGLPLFFVAVIGTAVKFIGVEPFVGTSDATVFAGFERFMTSPALYGIWCAVAIWVAISICHIVLSKFVKNGKARMFSVLAIILVLMLGTMGIMDAAYDAKINKIMESAPAGVTVEDYHSQLSYYDYVSFNRRDKSLINQLADRVDLYEHVYNVEFGGIDKSGEAGNIANKPVRYEDIIADDGTVGVAGKSGVVEVEPGKDGKLKIGDKAYSHYYYVTRTAANGHKVYVWYSTDLVPVGYNWKAKKGSMAFKTTDGVYGEGLYNENGMLSDGWVFSLANVLEILEDVYAGEEYLAGVNQDYVALIKARAEELRTAYYTGTMENYQADKYTQALYAQEAANAAKYGVTEGRVSDIVSKVAAMLGDNALFDWVFTNENASSLLGLIPGVGDIIGGLSEGISLSATLQSLLKTDATTTAIITSLIIHGFDIESECTDLFIKADYKNEAHDHLFITFYGEKDGKIDLDNVLGDVDFADGFTEVEVEGEDPVLVRNFDLDRLSDYLNTVLNALIANDTFEQIIDTVGGIAFKDMAFNGETYKGIAISGIEIPLVNSAGEFDVDVVGILTNLLRTYYNYQSPAIKPVWEFYVDAVKQYEAVFSNASVNYAEIAQYLADYERAYYEATVYGGMIGSTLIGDSLGNGNYAAGAGLTDLASVQQLKTDLSYQPGMFPLYAFRDMLLTFTAIVMFFYALSFVFAEKERKLAVEGEVAEGKATRKVGGSVGAFIDKATGIATQRGDKATRVRTIVAYVLFGLAFLPLLIAGIVIASKTTAIAPEYGGMCFLGFYILLVLAVVYGLVVAFVGRSKKSSATSKAIKIGVTFVCVTMVVGLLLTCVLPDPIANATSNTLFAEDMYYNAYDQVQENMDLEHQFIMNNLLNGNLNRYDKDGKVVENGDFAYASLTAHDIYPNGEFNYTNAEIHELYDDYLAKFGVNDVMVLPAQMKAASEKAVGELSGVKADLYNYIYNNYVLNDFDYALNAGGNKVAARRGIALAVTDYVYKHADVEKLFKDGFKNKKLKQLFDDNYDSFNQDGYKTFDDPLLLYAQMDGRMTMPVIIRLILNKGWTYSQGAVDGTTGKVTFDEDNTFLYEYFDTAVRDEFVAGGGAFDKQGKLMGGDGKEYNVNYGENAEGWRIYENGVVRRPLNWLVLDMLGTPMDLASIDLSGAQLLGFDITDVLGQADLNSIGVGDALGGLIDEDIAALVGKLTDGAGLRLGVHIDDNGQLNISLQPMNTTYAMLGYMQASWVQSNGLLMGVINLMALRNYLYLFAAIGLVFILMAGLVMGIEERTNKAAEAEGAAE